MTLLALPRWRWSQWTCLVVLPPLRLKQRQIGGRAAGWQGSRLVRDFPKPEAVVTAAAKLVTAVVTFQAVILSMAAAVKGTKGTKGTKGEVVPVAGRGTALGRPHGGVLRCAEW